MMDAASVGEVVAFCELARRAAQSGSWARCATAAKVAAALAEHFARLELELGAEGAEERLEAWMGRNGGGR